MRKLNLDTLKKPPPLPSKQWVEPKDRQSSPPPTAEFHSLEAKLLQNEIQEVDRRISKWVLGVVLVVEEQRVTRWYVMALLALHIILIIEIGLKLGGKK